MMYMKRSLFESQFQLQVRLVLEVYLDLQLLTKQAHVPAVYMWETNLNYSDHSVIPHYAIAVPAILGSS